MEIYLLNELSLGYWLLFIGLPLLITLLWNGWALHAQGTLKKYLGSDRSKQLQHAYRARSRKALTKLAAMALILMSLWNISIVGRKPTVVGVDKSIHLLVALDVSASMGAKDVAPSRIEKGKAIVQKVIAQLQPNDVVGVLGFGSQAFEVVPATQEKPWATRVLALLDTKLDPGGESNMTAVSDGVRWALKEDDSVVNAEGNRNKLGDNALVLVVSDGEGGSSKARRQIGDLNREGVVLSTLWIGKKKINLLMSTAIEASGKVQQKEQGERVVDNMALIEMADAGEGQAFDGNANVEGTVSAINKWIESTRQLQEAESKGGAGIKVYWILLLMAIALLTLEEAKQIKPKRYLKKVISKGGVAAVVLFVATSCSTGNKEKELAIENGQELYRRGQYARAAHWYEMALKHDSDDAMVYYNLALCYESQARMERSKAMYGLAISKGEKEDLVGMSHHNLARIVWKEGKKQDAIALQKVAVRLEPDNATVLGNYHLMLSEGLEKQQANPKTSQQIITKVDSAGKTATRPKVGKASENEIAQYPRVSEAEALQLLESIEIKELETRARLYLGE